MPVPDLDPTTTVGGGLIVTLLTALGYKFVRPSSVDREARRLAQQAIQDVEKLEMRLGSIESTLAVLNDQGTRNESGIADIRARMDTLQSAASAAAVQLATALGRVEGELRAKREFTRREDT